MAFGATPNSKQRPIIPLHAGHDDKRRRRFAKQESMKDRLRGFLMAKKTRRTLLALSVLFVMYRLYTHVGVNQIIPSVPKIKDAAVAADTAWQEVKRAVKAPIPEAAGDETTTKRDLDALADAANAAIKAEEKEKREAAAKVKLPQAPAIANKPPMPNDQEPAWKRQWGLEGAPGASAEELVSAIKNLVASVPVVVFSKTTCPYSSSAKTILSGLQMWPDPFIVEVDLRSDTSIVKNALTDLTHHSTFPNIFIGGKHIGGADDLHRLALDSKLVPILIKAGITFKQA